MEANLDLKSIKHHYIPQFYQKGFTDEMGFFWVYDKKKDTYLKKHPRQIFYEDHYNSIQINNENIPIIENLYTGIKGMNGSDQIFSNKINHLRSTALSENEIYLKEISEIFYFILQLTWRVPATENLNKMVINYYMKTNPSWFKDTYKIPEEMLNYPTDDLFKFIRFITPAVFLKEAARLEIGFEGSFKIVEWTNDIFCLSDYPIIWDNFPTNFNNFMKSFIFPISSKRVLILSNKSKENYSLTIENVNAINLINIYHSKRYIALKNKELLADYINKYKSLNHELNINESRNRLFNMI